MIPITVQIKNFLSYGAEMQTIDFGPYPLICLSGKNGHGKSALLDAITWALWGQARKTAGTAKPDQGLLRLGQTQMMVIFDFELNGNTYRVRREFALTYGKPYAQLEFGLLNKETQAIIPLTNKTIRATQEIIDQTLKLDFDAFTNSAFLRQGQANEFSKKSSKDRKEILASILGLGQYELLRKRALEKMRTAGAEKQTLTLLLEKYSLELAQKEPLTLQLEQVNQQLTVASEREQELETVSQQLEQAEKTLTEQKQAASLAQFKCEQLATQHQNNQLVLNQQFSLWRSIHRKQRLLTHQAHNQTTLLARKKELTHIITAHQHALQQQLELKQRHLEQTAIMQKHAQEITQAHAAATQKQQLELERLQLELKHLVNTQQAAQEQLAQATREQELIKQEHTLLIARVQEGSSLEAELQAQELTFERRKEFYQQFRMRGTLINTELQNSAQKKQLVHNEQDPSCPLCEQNLTAARRRFLQNKFSRTERLLVHQRNRLITVVKKLKEILVAQHEQIQQLRAKIQEQATIKLRISDSQTALQKSSHVASVLGEQRQAGEKKHAELSLQLDRAQQAYAALVAAGQSAVTQNSAYGALSAILENLEKQLAATHYSSAEHASAQRQLEELEKIIEEYTHIEREIALQQQRKQEILQLCAALRASKAQLAALQQELAQYSAINTQQADLENQKNKHAQERKQLHISKEQILQEKGSIQAKLLALAALEQERAQQQQQLENLSNTILDYQAIATATGKDGIQALLIEDAIPEIEHEANELLKKLTNNQAQIFIESLRDLKKGGTKETLDINISDAAGIRPYELFSGGEAFRIDFALRIAISKLLARRAGTALQTLIIDEGFGSQDEEGLGHIMDAIYKIQDDFAKVIIVSHLPTMKEQFPVHFVVEKSPEGSVVKILEQD